MPKHGVGVPALRSYDSSIGRFMSRDSYAGNAGSPLSLNRYTYVLNSPTLTADPSGLCSNQVCQPHACTDTTDPQAPTCVLPGLAECSPVGGCELSAAVLKNILGGGDELFQNTEPEKLAGELATARRLHVTPIGVGDPGFADVVNAGTIKWAVTADGRLLIIPKTVHGEELYHIVITGGAPVLAAGEADIAAHAGVFIGIEINNHSGHYLPSTASLSIGRAAFAAAGIVFP